MKKLFYYAYNFFNLEKLNLKYFNGKKIKSAVVRHWVITCCLLLGLFFSNISFGQFNPNVDCVNGCQAKDIKKITAYLVLPTPPNNTFPLSFSCNSGDMVNAKLAMDLTTSTSRVGIYIYANIRNSSNNEIIQTVSECFVAKQLGLTTVTKVVFNQSIAWSCGTNIKLTDVYIGWGTGTSDYCQTSPLPRCPATTSKCFAFDAGEYIPIVTPVGTPTGSTLCSDAKGGTTATFNLTNFDATILNGQTGTVTYYTELALSNQISPATSYSTINRTIYAKITSNGVSSAAIPVTLTVHQTPLLTIHNPAAVCSPGTVDITTAAVTAGSTLPSGTALSYWTNSDGTGAISGTAVGNGTYYIKATTNTIPACSDIKSVTVTVNTLPGAPAVSLQQPTCASANGTVTVTSPTGADYVYSNNGGDFQAGVSFTVAANAAYSITVKKVSSTCISLATTGTMGAQPITPGAPGLSLTQPTCASANGTVTVTSPTGADYVYSNNGGDFQADVSFTVAANAGYSITVKKVSSTCISLATTGTMGAQPVTPDAPGVSLIQPTCASANGTVSVTSPLGADYVYSNGGAFQAGTDFTVAANNGYSITVKSLSSTCISLATTGTMGAQPNTPGAPGLSLTQPTCASANGTVTVTGPLGTDYVYSNNGGDFQAGVSFTVAANAGYSITVKSLSSTCISLATAGTMGAQPPTPTFTVCLVQPTLCSSAGSVTINASGGSDLRYSIDGVNFTNTTGVFSNLGSGSVTSIQVRNAAGCISAPGDCTVSSCSPPISSRTSNTTNIVTKSLPTTNVIINSDDVLVDQTTIKAYPNPFSDKVKFVVNSKQSGNGTLEVYNVLGQKIKTVYQGFVNEGINNFEMSLPNQNNAQLIYKFNMGVKQVSGKITQIKQ